MLVRKLVESRWLEVRPYRIKINPCIFKQWRLYLNAPHAMFVLPKRKSALFEKHLA
jgi:hypothetical protein